MAGTVQATVLTDEECQPDARGISHCLNHLRPGRQRARSASSARHEQVAGLSPGEDVRLVPTVVS